MITATTISVGDFLDPKLDDKQFARLDDAIEEARGMSNRDDNRAVAVWVGYDPERVFLRGYELKPVN